MPAHSAELDARQAYPSLEVTDQPSSQKNQCMNSKENWLRLIRNNHPGWIGPPWEPFKGNDPIGMFVADPISQSLFVEGPVYDVPQKDAWGVTWLWRFIYDICIVR